LGYLAFYSPPLGGGARGEGLLVAVAVVVVAVLLLSFLSYISIS